jgi:hypothetical protein
VLICDAAQSDDAAGTDLDGVAKFTSSLSSSALPRKSKVSFTKLFLEESLVGIMVFRYK